MNRAERDELYFLIERLTTAIKEATKANPAEYTQLGNPGWEIREAGVALLDWYSKS